jgi:nicotinamidase/pyrazinamidase
MRALVLVDIQNDFVPGGALPVPEGDKVVPIANRVQPLFDLVVATQDWHPQNHGSFAANHPGKHPGEVIDLNGLPQILWPVHCVQGTPGAEFVPGLEMRQVASIIHKGTDPEIDSYSGFFDNGHRKATGLEAYLKSQGVDDVYVMGLATDYCVKFTVLDAVQQGFRTFRRRAAGLSDLPHSRRLPGRQPPARRFPKGSRRDAERRRRPPP